MSADPRQRKRSRGEAVTRESRSRAKKPRLNEGLEREEKEEEEPSAPDSRESLAEEEEEAIKAESALLYGRRTRRVRSSSARKNPVTLAYCAGLGDEEYLAWHKEKINAKPIVVDGKILRLVTSAGIHNNVLTAKLNFPVDLLELKEVVPFMGAEYSTTKKFPSLGLHFVTDGVGSACAPSIFGTGNIVCPGCETNEGAIFDILRVVDFLELHFPGIGPPEIVLRNVVGAIHMQVYIDLKVLVRHIEDTLKDETDAFHPPKYEPGYFPGVQWGNKKKIMFLIFQSGAGVITNARNLKDIMTAAREIYEIIWECGIRHPGSVQVAL